MVSMGRGFTSFRSLAPYTPEPLIAFTSGFYMSPLWATFRIGDVRLLALYRLCEVFKDMEDVE
jgi:hypothetical protein